MTVLQGRFYCHAHSSDEGAEHKEHKPFVRGYTARKWQSWSITQVPESEVLTTWTSLLFNSH